MEVQLIGCSRIGAPRPCCDQLHCFSAGSDARIDAKNRHVIPRCRNRIGRNNAGQLDISICYASGLRGNTRNREARYLRSVVSINCILYPPINQLSLSLSLSLSITKTQYLLLKTRDKKNKAKNEHAQCKLHSPSSSCLWRRRPPLHSPAHRSHQRCRAAGVSSTTSSALRPVFCPAQWSVRIAAVSSNSPGLSDRN